MWHNIKKHKAMENQLKIFRIKTLKLDIVTYSYIAAGICFFVDLIIVLIVVWPQN